MTVCSNQLTFDFYQDKDLTADFKGGQISSDTGLLAVRELEKKLGWLTDATSVLSDPRDAQKTRHDILTLLRQRVFGLVGGYEDCNDHDRLRGDPVLKLTCDRSPAGRDVASQPTLSRFENGVAPREVVRLGRLLTEHFVGLYRNDPPEQIVLDIDPTDDPCHGHQQLSLFNGFYEQRMYLPLLVFERQTGMLLGARLRAGDVHPARRAIQMLGPMVETLREAFPQAPIILRADAGFSVPRLYDWCEEKNLRYLIAIASHPVFKRHTDPDVQWMRRRYERAGEARRHYSSYWHRAGSWPHKRRVTYKVKVGPDGTQRRFIVTNMKGHPVHLHRLYEDRGTCETFIDGFKNALRADRLSCHRFTTNAFRLLMFAFGYNLLKVLGSHLADTVLAGASLETIRTRLLKVGARVRETVRRVWVHIAGGFPYREALATVMRRIRAMPNAPPAAA